MNRKLVVGLEAAIHNKLCQAMTETQWLTSDNPAEMVAFLGARITDEQRRFFAEACRKSWCKVSGPVMEHYVPLALRADILRDIVGNPFKKLPFIEDGKLCEYVTKPGFNVELAVESEWLTWRDGTIPKMVDAMLFENCSKCGIRRGERYVFAGPDSHWERCDCTNGRIPRAEPRWEMMPIIADALEEAGCRDQYILEHLRGDVPWDCQSMCGNRHNDNCKLANGTGQIKRRHYIGCWVVELLRGKP